MIILDCTLRDGGYYNSWDFSEELVADYLKAVSLSGITHIELGLRNLPQNSFLGAFAYTSEEYLNSLSLPDGITYGVMLDAQTILTSDKSVHDTISSLFVAKKDSKISLVRIASYIHDVEASMPIARQLKKLGYQVGFNLMQSSGKSAKSITKIAQLIHSWKTVDVLYFADSIGNMDSAEVKRIIHALRQEWPNDLGIHTHNNMGRALDNSLFAIDSGVKWIDSTVAGMGRGAGNTATEKLLACLSLQVQKENNNFYPFHIYELVIQRFYSLKKQYGWGEHLLYFLGAQHNVHPTYIQNMLSNSHLGKEELVGSIKYLIKESGANKYDGKLLEAALSLGNATNEGQGETLAPVFKDSNVLIITNAPGIEQHKRALELYIKKYQPIVIGINLVDKLHKSLFNYFCISHNIKFLSDYRNYQQLNKPLIYPRHRFKKDERSQLNSLSNSIDYGIKIDQKQFLPDTDHCTIPYDLTIAYALSVAIKGQAKQIMLAGLDGYSANDKRQQEMINLFQLVQEKYPTIDIYSITPTTYPIKNGSVYAML